MSRTFCFVFAVISVDFFFLCVHTTCFCRYYVFYNNSDAFSSFVCVFVSAVRALSELSMPPYHPPPPQIPGRLVEDREKATKLKQHVAGLCGVDNTRYVLVNVRE